MANYIISNGQLYNTDDLRHWKYVKREKKNGKWRYYYKNSELDNAKKEYDNAKDHSLVANINRATNQVSLDTAKKEFEKDGKVTAEEKAVLDYQKSAAETSKREHAAAEKRLAEAKKKYQKTKIKTIIPSVIAKGVAAIGNLFSKRKKKKG